MPDGRASGPARSSARTYGAASTSLEDEPVHSSARTYGAASTNLEDEPVHSSARTCGVASISLESCSSGALTHITLGKVRKRCCHSAFPLASRRRSFVRPESPI